MADCLHSAAPGLPDHRPAPPRPGVGRAAPRPGRVSDAGAGPGRGHRAHRPAATPPAAPGGPRPRPATPPRLSPRPPPPAPGAAGLLISAALWLRSLAPGAAAARRRRCGSLGQGRGAGVGAAEQPGEQDPLHTSVASWDQAPLPLGQPSWRPRVGSPCTTAPWTEPCALPPRRWGRG